MSYEMPDEPNFNFTVLWLNFMSKDMLQLTRNKQKFDQKIYEI